MKNRRIDITMVGVGGQGIGLLSETLLRAFDHAGMTAKGVDTHGLAQRGGEVVSHLRVGRGGGSPLVEPGRTDLLLGLDRSETLRGMGYHLRQGGCCLYYDANWQSLPVRRGESPLVTGEMLEALAEKRGVTLVRIHREDLSDSRMQNIVLLGGALEAGVLPGLSLNHIKAALEDLMEESLARASIALLKIL